MKRNELLQWILLLLLSAQLLLSIFGNTASATQTALSGIQNEVTTVGDSLQAFQLRFEEIKRAFEANQIELAILRKERHLLKMEHQKAQLHNRKELEILKAALASEKEIYQHLLEKARQFEK